MNRKKAIWWVGLAIVLPILGACSSNEPKSEVMELDKDSATASTGSGQRPASQATPPKAAIIVQNPTVITFEKMAVTLDNKAKEQIAQTVERAKQAKKIVITGYCDKRQVGNPSDTAVARAVVTRDELVRYGVPPAAIQVKFVTNVAKKHAAEIKFD